MLGFFFQPIRGQEKASEDVVHVCFPAALFAGSKIMRQHLIGSLYFLTFHLIGHLAGLVFA